MLIGPATYLVLRAVERRAICPIGSGLIIGTYMAVYSSLRMIVEPFKEIGVEQLRDLQPFHAVEQVTGLTIRTGQWLSIVPLAAGVFLIWRALRDGGALLHSPTIARGAPTSSA